MSKLYATFALLIFIGLAWWQYSSAITDRDKYKAESITYKAELSASKELVEAKEVLLTQANQRATNYLKAKEEVENEARANRDCIANNTCGVIVRYKQAICSGMPGTTTSGPTTNDSTGTSAGDFARWYVSLEEAIEKNNLKIEALQKDVLVRANPSYCLPKTNKVE